MNFKFIKFAGGTIGRAPDSAQLQTRPYSGNQNFTETSTGGKENRDSTRKTKSGQALVLLLVFVATVTIVTAAAVTITIINSQTTSKFASGEETLQVAEAGAEYAIVRLFQNPNYAGETLTVGAGSATITVTPGASPKTILSIGQVGNFIRKVQVVGTFANFTFTPTSWQQID